MSNVTKGLLLGGVILFLGFLILKPSNDQQVSKSTKKGTVLVGAGATFPYPLYSKMFDEYHNAKGTKVNYQAIGSGGGIRQLKNKTVDFGASDAFLSDKKLKNMDREVIHIPICSGAVALAYNLPGNPNIKLSPSTLADIYLGNITNWNDQRIAKINPNVNLPNLNVATIQRSDGSGTTYIFTDYLSKISPEWKSKVGTGKAVNWPVGLAGKGNAGVAGLIKQVPGSIGYVGSVYAIQNKMAVVSLKNKSGRYIEPSLASITEASNTTIPDDTRVSLTNTESKNGYPISGLTWVLVYKDQSYNNRTISQAQETVNLIDWMITDGQQYAEALHFSPLPKLVVKKAKSLLNTIEFNNKRIN